MPFCLINLILPCTHGRRNQLETRLTAKRNEVASMEARADPMARQPALEADIARLQGEACAAVRTAPAKQALPGTLAFWKGFACLLFRLRGHQLSGAG